LQRYSYVSPIQQMQQSLLLLYISHRNHSKKVTITFAVEANCGDCKNRIESALDKKGVLKAVFNLESKILTVTYDPRKLQEIQLHNMVAMVGHDTEKVKASNVVYESLPDCCKYRQDDDGWEHNHH